MSERVDTFLARLYVRWGAEYLRRGWVYAWLGLFAGGAAGTALAVQYLDFTIAEAGGLLATTEAGIAVMMALGARYPVRRRAEQSLAAWWAAGRSREGAVEAWEAVGALPLQWSLLGWPTGVLLQGIPISAYAALVADLQPGETATVFAAVLAAGVYAALLGSFSVEVCVRPVIRDIARRLPPGHAPERARPPISGRLFATLLMTSGSTGFFVAVGVSVGSGSLDELAEALALTTLVTLTITLACSLLSTGSTTRPLADLLAATRRIRVGDMGARVPVTSQDEFGQLAASFNEMTAALQRSQARIVAAGDAERRRVERNIHDGAQQRLVALSLDLRMLEEAIGTVSDEDLRRMTADAEASLRSALDELRELARGLHPSVLSSDGLRPALEQLGRAAPVPVVVYAPDERYPQLVESTAYFVACEALANVAKYAGASRADISVERIDGRLLVEVRDDGVGGADPAAGSGLEGLRDRVGALAGSLSVQSPPGAGTKVVAQLPIEPPA